MEAIENFPEVDFSSIKLNLTAATSSLLQASFEDVNVEDNATTLPPKDDPKVNAPLLKDDTFIFSNPFIFFPLFWFFFWFGL